MQCTHRAKAQTRDLPCARQGSPAARHGSYRQVSLSMATDRVGRLRNNIHVRNVLEIVFVRFLGVRVRSCSLIHVQGGLTPVGTLYTCNTVTQLPRPEIDSILQILLLLPPNVNTLCMMQMVKLHSLTNTHETHSSIPESIIFFWTCWAGNCTRNLGLKDEPINK